MSPSPASSVTEAAFDRIVGGFYTAATGGMEWRDALILVQDAFGARAAMLFTMDVTDGRMLSLESGGAQLTVPTFEYVSAWQQQDPRKRRALKQGQPATGEWLHCSDTFDERVVQHNGFFRHFLTAHQIRYNSHVTLALDERTTTTFMLELPPQRGPLGADERELARRFGVHLEQALLAQERVRRLATQALAGHHLLDAFSYPMWLIDIERRILFANKAATQQEKHDADVRRQAACLRLASTAADQKLNAVLLGMASAAHRSQQHLRLDPGSAQPVWLHLTVLVPDAAMGAFGQQRCVLATLFDPAYLSALDPFVLSQLFALTPSEARVAALLGEGLGPVAIADKLQVQLSTVRTHIRKVLAAMGQPRMIDAVRVLRQGGALWSAALAAAQR